ncbi:MAG: hypothetical protein M1825_005466 [Sarcosagium campestre]|nr:MAG: hypothetical protein M1825_005466 [Sarcosagium campestre]
MEPIAPNPVLALLSDQKHPDQPNAVSSTQDSSNNVDSLMHQTTNSDLGFSQRSRMDGPRFYSTDSTRTDGDSQRHSTPGQPLSNVQPGQQAAHTFIQLTPTVPTTTPSSHVKYDGDSAISIHSVADSIDGSSHHGQADFSQAEDLPFSGPGPTHGTDIEVDDDWSDPGFETGSDTSSFLSKLSSTITAYQWENGRRYHGYKEGSYPLPNDDIELDREDMKHQEMMLITDNRLHLAPISKTPHKILDVGTGTGIWAMEMADKYPSAEVVGTDLSPVQPKWVPPNLTFEIDDIESPWTYTPNSLDLIHVRFMFLAIKDFGRLLRQAMTALKPGGYIELSELAIQPGSHDGTLPPSGEILRWIGLLREASRRMGYDLNIASRFKQMVVDAGYEDVTEHVLEVPWGGWPKDPRLKTIGVFHKEQLKQGLQGIAMALFTRALGWTQAEVEVFLVKLREELSNKDIHITDHA